MPQLLEIVPGKAPDHTILLLPYRKLNGIRKLGLLGLVVSSFQLFIAFGLISVAIKLNGLNNNNVAPMPVRIIGLFMVVFAAYVSWFGIRIAIGSIAVAKNKTRTRIELQGRKMTCYEKIGPFSFRRQLLLVPDYILFREPVFDRLKVLGEALHKRFNLQEQMDCWYSLRLGSQTLRQCNHIVVFCYSEEVIAELEATLYSLVPTTSQPTLSAPTPIGQLSTRATDRLFPGSPSQSIQYEPPENTRIKVDRRDSGVTFQIPSSSFTMVSYGILVFACMWLGFISVFDYFLLQGQPLKGQAPAEQVPTPVILIIGFLHLVGIGLFILGVYLRRRTATIATSYGMLLVSETTIFGKRSQEWNENSVRSIDVVPSNVSVNKKPLLELQIINHEGNSYRCLNTISQDELNWIAWEISASLELTQQAPETPSAQ